MATLTIRNLDDRLKSRLRLQAATHNRSMEEEARQILRRALQSSVPSGEDLGTRIHARFVALGDVRLDIEPREPLRDPPDLSSPKVPARSSFRKPGSGRP